MIIISGCPRSGTSMMMRVMSSVLGEDRILGKKFPREKKTVDTSKLNDLNLYRYNKRKDRAEKMGNRPKELNPNGFHEMEFSVSGINYSQKMSDTLDNIITEDKASVCKIVSQGLAKSDPRFISKIIYMIRDPRAVAKSQERLARNNPMDEDMAPEHNGQKVLFRSVQMFNSVTVAAAQWITKNSHIPVSIINYDDMIDDPETVLSVIQNFVGEGNFLSASSMIDSTLRRSEASSNGIDGNLDHSMALYGHVCRGDWAAIIGAEKTEIKRRSDNPESWNCFRGVPYACKNVCDICISKEPNTLKNMIANAKKRGVDWVNEPCVYECGADGSKGITVQESIDNNHWCKFVEDNDDDLDLKDYKGCCG